MMAPSLAAAATANLDQSEARAIIVAHSKSFSLASLLLGRTMRADAEALYAYCRRADDAIDLAPPAEQAAALRELRRELDAIYGGGFVAHPAAAGLQKLALARELPHDYPAALLEGFELDVSGRRYATLDELLHYCWCVAGSVGAMMCHVLGVARERAIVHGAHLGMAMQLTNICRDVAEDWERGRLYVPHRWLPALELRGAAPPPALHEPLAVAVKRLLTEADKLYRSGELGLRYLPPRARFAVAAARRLYAGIGQELRARDFDVLGGRAVVPGARKLACVARAGLDTVVNPGVPRRRPRLLRTLRFPGDVLPV
jgi:15-cis-phytoene synthase